MRRKHNRPVWRKAKSPVSKEIGYFGGGLMAGAVLLLIVLPSCTDMGKSVPPNVVLITADDLGLQLSCYGDSTVSTPNIDALAGSGTRFTNAYVTQASCSPSRSSIFTGLYPHRNGQLGLSHRGEFSMVPGLRTLPKMFKDMGYATGVIGKVHVKPTEDFPFDYNTNEGFPTQETRDVIRVRDSVASFLGQFAGGPFFLMVNYFDPHRPYHDIRINGLPEHPLTRDDVEAFSFLGMSTGRIMEDITGYYNCVKRLDEGIGMLMDELDSRGLTGNTLILFLGDHGPPFPRAKVSCYEAGLKIPFAMAWPGKVRAGEVRDEFVSTIDIFPTLAGAIGWDGEFAGEGHSLLEITGEEGSPPWREYLFAEYNAHQSSSFHPQRTIRYKNHKLILTLIENRTFVGDNRPPPRLRGYLDQAPGSPEMKAVFDIYITPPGIQLFDLDSDPDERINLAERPEYDSIKVRMLGELQEWRERTKDPFLDEGILAAMAREQDSLKSLGVYRDYRSAFTYLQPEK